MILRTSDSTASSSGKYVMISATLAQTSTRPNASRAAAARPSTSARSVTSVRQISTFPGRADQVWRAFQALKALSGDDDGGTGDDGNALAEQERLFRFRLASHRAGVDLELHPGHLLGEHAPLVDSRQQPATRPSAPSQGHECPRGAGCGCRCLEDFQLVVAG